MVQKRQLFRYAVDTFIDTLQQVTKRKRINYKCNDADIDAWNNFIDTYPSAGEDYVNRFILFGIQSWFNSSTEKDYSRDIRFIWIFGKAAIQRWQKLNIGIAAHIVRKELKQNHSVQVSKRKTRLNKIVNTLRTSEENAKAEYHNTKRGLAWCIANTTLYFHKSSWCATCDFKKDCKETLKNNYPKIYRWRGYGE